MEFSKCNYWVIQKTRTMGPGESRVDAMTGSNLKSTLIEKEMKQLEKIKFKQQKEIEQTIQYEMKL